MQAGVRIDGGMQNADTVGTIVWAKSSLAKGAWWPAEVLDPFFMPFSHTLPPASVLGEQLRLRKIWFSDRFFWSAESLYISMSSQR